MAKLGSILNHKLVEEIGKLQLNMLNKFDNIIPQFKQLGDMITEQNNTLVITLEKNQFITQ
jgi:hypothetical protein